MIYAFVFLGEFGYELFNWQGLVRNFKAKCNDSDKIIIGGRNGMDIWYPYADAFIDISENPLFKSSRANCYWAHKIDSPFDQEYMDELKASLHSQIEKQLKSIKIVGDNSNINFIFSCDFNLLNGIYFGPHNKFFNIYGGEGHKQNLYEKISYDSAELKNQIEETLSMKLSKPYILIQARKRDIVIRSTYVVPIEKLIKKLSEKINVVLLNFDTGRAHDSKSELAEMENCHSIQISSSHEQAILIKYASECIFSTENDFGSHIYVPPFMGKDVIAIAGEDVYRIGTTPIKFWNDSIFKFGGKILPFISEKIFNTENSLKDFCKYIFQRVSAKIFFNEVEEKGNSSKIEDFLLWPNTPPPPKDHQLKITERIGVSDTDINDPRSRSHSLLTFINYLIQNGKMSYPFTLADICGGDGVVCTKIKEFFPQAEIIVQDCFKNKFETHKYASEIGIKLYGGYLQHIVEGNLAFEKLDIVLMLNTFRGWHSAQLRKHEENLLFQTLQWFEKNSRFIIVTATKEQIIFLQNNGFKLKLIGKGEDDSYMICFSRNDF
ncbi:MAG: hypothetical protein IJ728_13900 [Selenomonadaceae bacterium]|nr:hypothetical protein [Selenomonadaceae bacterium]